MTTTSQSDAHEAKSATVSENPYVGPRTFSAQQSHLYFGREREARDLLSLVIANRVVLFFSQSGAGKSSLINTRLIPGLEERGFEVLPVARVGGSEPAKGITPQNIYAHTVMTYLDRRDALESRFAQKQLDDLLPAMTRVQSESGTFWQYEANEGDELDEMGELDEIDEIDEGDAYELRPRVLILDQFEEILTTHPEAWEQREDFFHQLNQALEDDPYLWLVLAMREDYVGGLTPFIHLLPGSLRVRYHMERMDVKGALDAIREPAELSGYRYGSEVAEQLVNNLRQIRVAGQADAQPGQYLEPVQLQVVCYQLWERLHEDEVAPAVDSSPPVASESDRQECEPHPETENATLRLITQENLRTFGDVDTALTDFYERVLRDVLTLPNIKVSQRKMRDWFSNQMITSAQTRSTAYRNEETGETAGLPNEVVDELASRFLLRTELRAGGAWTELIHDRFVVPIRRANARWLANNPNPIELTRLRWSESGQNEDQLPDGYALRQLESFAQENDADIGDEDRDFVTRSRNQVRIRDEEVEKKRKRDRRLQLYAAGFLIAMTLLTAYSIWSSIRADNARVEADEAKNEAIEQAEIAAANEASALAAKAAAVVAEAEAEANAGAAAEAQAQAEVALLDAQRQASIAEIREWAAKSNTAWENDRPIESLTLAARAVSAGQTISPSIRIASSEQALRTGVQNVGGQALVGHENLVRALAFSPDGEWLATGSEDNTARLWNVAQPEAEPIVLRGHENWVRALAFSPDGEWLATGSSDNTARLWNVAQPEAEPIVLRGHENWVIALAFSPDGEWLATGSSDNTARLWNVAQPEAEPIVLRGHEGDIFALAFSPDGEWARHWQRGQHGPPLECGPA